MVGLLVGWLVIFLYFCRLFNADVRFFKANIWFQVFPSNTNYLQAIIWFQVFLYNFNYFQVS